MLLSNRLLHEAEVGSALGGSGTSAIVAILIISVIRVTVAITINVAAGGSVAIDAPHAPFLLLSLDAVAALIVSLKGTSRGI
jgi:hypothetical protein